MSTHRKFSKDRPRTDFLETFNDFILTQEYAAGDYTITDVGTSADAQSTSVANGVLEIVTGATSANSSFLQGKVSAFKPTLGKAIEFEARIKIDSVLLPDWIFGLQITDTTPLAVSDGIWFQNDTGDALLDFHAAKASVQSDLVGIATIVDDTWFKIGFYYDGSDPHIQAFLNDQRVGALPMTNFPTTQQLALSFGIKTNAAVARKLSIDYIRVCQER